MIVRMNWFALDGMIRLRIGVMMECRLYRILICMFSAKPENLVILLLLKEKNSKLIESMKRIMASCLFGLF